MSVLELKRSDILDYVGFCGELRSFFDIPFSEDAARKGYSAYIKRLSEESAEKPLSENNLYFALYLGKINYLCASMRNALEKWYEKNKDQRTMDEFIEGSDWLVLSTGNSSCLHSFLQGRKFFNLVKIRVNQW